MTNNEAIEAEREALHPTLQLLLAGHSGQAVVGCCMDVVCEAILQGAASIEEAHAALDDALREMKAVVAENWATAKRELGTINYGQTGTA